uniref:Uncharacterized protein n=1 Tax=uncultured marine bacterium PPT_M2 TaxID=1381397 RepID=A0A067XSN9_9BACT|nr:hypothetical protein PPT_M2_04 [uncultured marine bacterium PPT_M2]
MIRTKTLASCLVLLAGFTEFQTAVAQERVKTPKQNSANEKQVLAKPDLSADEARMIVKDIPSVDIRATLGAWKPSETELGQLRQWSGILVEKPGTTEFLAKWSELIRQAHARTPHIKESSITPLIRMVMLAAYEEAQKHQTTSAASAPSEVYKQLQEQLRANLVEARQLQSLMGSERKDPLSGSRLSLPAHQRTLRKCDVVGEPKKMECKEVLVSASYELDDYVSASEAQLAKTEEEAKRGGGASQSGQEKRRQMLYALSDVAKAMHDSAVAVLRKAGR